MIKTIELLVSSTGETRLETKGFAGSSCQEASRLLEAALGSCQSETMTTEYFQSVAATLVHQENRQ
jgi:hypothetical protein